jgi:hypothetical protein
VICGSRALISISGSCFWRQACASAAPSCRTTSARASVGRIARLDEGLSQAWTITPVGGSDKVPTFLSLLGSQKKLKLATLIDFQKKDQQTIENLYKKKLLAKKNVRTFADFTATKEADIEDMFDRQFYLDLVNAEYTAELQQPIALADLGQHPRILVNIEEHLKVHPLKAGGFNHYRPARYFAENIATLGPKLDAATLDRFEAAFKALNGLL